MRVALTLAIPVILAATPLSARDYPEQTERIVATIKRVEMDYVETLEPGKFWNDVQSAFAASASDSSAFTACFGAGERLDEKTIQHRMAKAIDCGKGELEAEAYIDNVLQTAMQRLGPRNSYITATEMERLSAEARAVSMDDASVGLSIKATDGGIEIVSIHSQSPLVAFGLKPGDALVSVADVQGKELSLARAIELLRGSQGEELQLSIRRRGQAALTEIAVKRKILIPEPFRIQLLENCAIIDSLTMAAGGSEQLSQELAKPEYRNSVGLIMDLRGNQGGLLEEVVMLADIFIEKGELFSVKGRSRGDVERFYARTKGSWEKKPVVVLIDGSTASGGEILAAVLQNHKRADVMGVKTMGIVDIQTLIPLSANEAMRLTTQYVYLPGDILMDGGVTPADVLDIKQPGQNKSMVANSMCLEAAISKE